METADWIQGKPEIKKSQTDRFIRIYMLEDRVDWRHEAACRDEDPELFFPIGNTGPAILQIEEAKAVCRRCKVIEPCLKWALETGQDSGVWGGTSEDERRAIKRRAQRARARGLEPAPHVFETDLPVS
jgi:WhiB family redox-sensing transcriptional regulator